MADAVNTPPRPEDARHDIERILSVHRGVYRHTASALAGITGHSVALVRDELEGLEKAGKVRRHGSGWTWIHVQ